MESVLIHSEDHVGRAWESKRPSFGGLLLKMFHVEHLSITIGVDPWVCASCLELESQAWDSWQQGEQRKRVPGYSNLRCAGSSWIERGYWSQRDDVLGRFFLKMFHVKHLSIGISVDPLKMFHVEHSKTAGRSE